MAEKKLSPPDIADLNRMFKDPKKPLGEILFEQFQGVDRRLEAKVTAATRRILSQLFHEGLKIRANKRFEIASSATGDDLFFTAKLSGIKGNDISIHFKDPAGPNSPLSIDAIPTLGKAIVVNLGTDGGSALDSTLQEVFDLMQKDKDVRNLGSLTLLSAGTAVVDTAVGPTNLENGEMICSL